MLLANNTNLYQSAIEQLLIDNKDFLYEVINVSPSLIFIKDKTGKFILANDAFCKTFGYTLDQILNKWNHEIHSNKKDTDRYSKVDEEVIKTQKEIHIEEFYTLPNGEIAWYDTVKIPLLQPNGDVYVLAISTDITQRKHVQEQLKLNEIRMKEAQRMARFGNWEFDLVTQAINWSDEVYRLFGVTPSAQGPSYHEYLSHIHPDDLDKVMANIERALVKAVAYEMDHRVISNDGTVKTIHALCKPLIDEKGNVIKLFGTVLEVTDRKKAEQELVIAKQQAEESARDKETFLANVSHEIRTPINGILGMARLLQKTKLDSKQRSYLDILRITGDNLLMIVNDILDIAKIESGKLSIEKIPFKLENTADIALQTQMYKAEEKDLGLHFYLPQEPFPMVIGDPHRLNQILLNLLSNAIKFTEHGKVEMSCAIVAEDSVQLTIEFSVRDTGIGIAADNPEKIFESFTQATDDTSRKYGGTGLGLAISKNLVEMQGGRIWVTSQPGKGSDFRFQIPYNKAPTDVVITKSASHIEYTSLGKLRVLMAEDNRLNQYVTEAMLQDWGFIVDLANNGKEALSLLTQFNYDIVLMDIQMPELNGVETTKLIRKLSDSRKANVPIIALTANPSRTLHKKYLSEGMSDLLIKPYKEETLFTKIAAQIKLTNPSLITSLQRPRFPTRRKPVSNNESLYDLSLLRNNVRNNEEFIKRMLDIFIDTIPPLIAQMLDHFNRNEIDSICSIAHKIKPTLDGAGIISLRETIRNIENFREKKRTRDQLGLDLNKLNEVIGKVIEEFQKKRNSMNDIKS